MSACSSARMQQLASHWIDFIEIWYVSIFRKSVMAVHISPSSDKTNKAALYMKTDVCTFVITNVKQPRYRPGVAQSVPGS